MAKSKIDISEENLYGWICSVGYLLPSNEQELIRFEALYPAEQIKVREENIDPFAIINGTRKRKELSFAVQALDEDEQQQLRMAARKHQDIPQDIIDRIKRNQRPDDQPDRSQNS